jgi:uncharacterized protein YjbI with pentapeptide repeats
MKKTTLTRSDLRGQRIVGEKYEGFYLQSGNYDEAEFLNCIFVDVEFEGSWLNETRFKSCEIRDTLFYAIQGYSAKFCDSLFSKVEFRGCNLANVDFSNCIFEDVIFGADDIGSVTDISGAHLGDADLSRVKFFDVEYDVETIFPDEFDPRREIRKE